MHVDFPQIIDRPAASVGARDSSSFLRTMASGLELLSPTTGAKLAFELLSNAASTKRYLELLQELQATLRDAGVPVVVAEPKSGRNLVPLTDLSRAQRRWLGQVALELFFTQLFFLEHALLDLRPARFGIDAAGDAVWHPRPLYVRWEQRFLRSLRDIYAGFFLGQDARLHGGLAELGLAEDAHILLDRLGTGNQRGVRFRMRDLHSTLRIMAPRHLTNPTVDHRSFAAFGLHLAALFELLESLDLAFDVRSAFMRSHHGH